ncbi:MAG TPA: PP2C family protein-serine/threonine phosphatase [Terracidiphilus sp.]|nr:PP2C family protein-serine/threonine phosphatase [Terracidiphilus sp.]
MAGRFGGSLLLMAVCAICAQGHATPAVPMTLNNSTVALSGPWKFKIGDSPTDPRTGKLLWAEPGFDDSDWENMDLKPVPGLPDPYNGDTRYVPGWTARGYAGYMGYAWYRLRIPAVGEDGSRLALACPVYVDDGYQVYANAELIGSFGSFDRPGEPPRVSSTAPAMLLLTKPAIAATTGDQTQLVAFRVWMGPMGLTHSPYAGGLHYAPLLGDASAIAAQVKLDWLQLVLQSAFAPFEGVLLFLLGIVSAGLILFDPSDRVYLWVAGVLLFTAFSDAALTVFTLTQQLSLRTYFMFFDVFSNPIVLCGWIMVWWYWFHLRRPAWLPRAVGALMLLYMFTKAIGGDFFYGAHPHPPEPFFLAVSVGVRLIFLPLFIYVIALGIRKQGMEGWLVLPAVVPLVLTQFSSEMIVLNLPVKWSPFGVTIFVSQVANLVSAGAISLLLLRRLLLSVRRQRQVEFDVRQAQEVQRMIVPAARTRLPGLVIESEYRPETEVGGDFFQIVEHPTNGSVLIVAGDVVGKGLKAGMIVALLVGATRSTAELNSDPEFVLSALNRRLLGRGDAQATCLAIRILRDGAVTLANAGHMPPYLNGEPLALDGALPLGMVKQAEFSRVAFQMKEGDRLMVVSDGIAEAKDPDGHLFSFERVHELLRSGKSAAEIATAAQVFGQQDDISVISVTRTVSLNHARA